MLPRHTVLVSGGAVACDTSTVSPGTSSDPTHPVGHQQAVAHHDALICWGWCFFGEIIGSIFKRNGTQGLRFILSMRVGDAIIGCVALMMSRHKDTYIVRIEAQRAGIHGAVTRCTCVLIEKLLQGTTGRVLAQRRGYVCGYLMLLLLGGGRRIWVGC